MGSDEPEFDFSSLGPGPAHFDLARTMAGEGAAFSEIAERLRAGGLRPDFTWKVMCEIAGEVVRCRVIAGLPDDKIQHDLMLRGLREDEARAVIDSVRRTYHCRQRLAGLPAGKSGAVGVTLVTIGVVLWLGNATGLLPTFSGAGALLMIAGGAIAGVDFLKKPRR